jgi:hypothetical protein
MTRFPLRLRVALAKATLLQKRNSNEWNSPILYLRAEELLHTQSLQPVAHEAVREILRDQHPIVWIGGSEPLTHPGIGHLTRLISQHGHFVFLETDGILLRQRIHEFQPSPRFYLTIRFLGWEAEHDRRTGRQGAFRAAMEGIRAAQLSGFLICANVDLEPGFNSAELALVCAELGKLELDGVLLSSASASANLEEAPRVTSSGWARFSQLIESAASAGLRRPAMQPVSAGVASASENDCEEGVQA